MISAIAVIFLWGFSKRTLPDVASGTEKSEVKKGAGGTGVASGELGVPLGKGIRGRREAEESIGGKLGEGE